MKLDFQIDAKYQYLTLEIKDNYNKRANVTYSFNEWSQFENNQIELIIIDVMNLGVKVDNFTIQHAVGSIIGGSKRIVGYFHSPIMLLADNPPEFTVDDLEAYLREKHYFKKDLK